MCRLSGQPQQSTGSAVVDSSEVVKAKVASRMRGAPKLDLVSSLAESEPEDEPDPDPKRKTLKSGMVRTTESGGVAT